MTPRPVPSPAASAGDPVTRNPFRVLGLPGEAGWPEIHAAVDRLLDAPEWESVTSPWDLPWLGPLDRSRASAERALARLSDPRMRLRDRLFWFHEAAAETAVYELLPNTLRNALEGWSATSRAVPRHDAAVVALLAAMTLDPRVEKGTPWQRAFQEWTGALGLEEYWLAVLQTEMEGGFESPASLGDVRDLRDEALRLVVEPLLDVARGAVVEEDSPTAARALAALRETLPKEVFNDLCGDLASHVWGAFDADWSTAPEAPPWEDDGRAEERSGLAAIEEVEEAEEPAEPTPDAPAPPRRQKADLWDLMDEEEGEAASGEPEVAEPGPAAAEPAPARPEPEPARPEPAPARPEPEPVRPEPEPAPARPEPEPVRPEPEPVQPEPEPVQPEPEPARPEPAPVEPARRAPTRRRLVRPSLIAAAAAAALVAVLARAAREEAPEATSPTLTAIERQLDASDGALADAILDRRRREEDVRALTAAVHDYQVLVEDYQRRMAERLPADPAAYGRVVRLRDEARQRLAEARSGLVDARGRVDRLKEHEARLVEDWNARQRDEVTSRDPSP